jgi:hypothetical protein
MGKKKQIEQISNDHARSIVLRFCPQKWSNEKDKTEKNMRTIARGFCRERGKTPKELIATPLPR